MKVLHVIDTLEVGGAEESTLQLAGRFRETELVMVHLYPGRTLAPRYESAGARVVSLDLPGRLAPGRGVAELVRLVRRERPDLLQSTLFRAGLVARATSRWTGVLLLDTLVNDSYSPHRWRSLTTSQAVTLAAVQRLDAATAPWTRHFVANSETVKASQCEALRIPPDRVTVIHRGRDPQRYQPVAGPERELLRERLGVAPGEPLLLNVARLLARKGHRALLRAFAQVLTRVPSARLAIAGDGPERPALERLAGELGLGDRLRFLGTRSNVPELLSAADLFVFPSQYEGHAGALLEAMMAGLPIVATDTPSHRETLTPGETGVLVPVDRPDELAAAILRLLGEPEEPRRLGEAAQRSAVERFGVDKAAARYEELYRRLAGGAP